MSQNLSSAEVMIGALRITYVNHKCFMVLLSHGVASGGDIKRLKRHCTLISKVKCGSTGFKFKTQTRHRLF